MGFEELLSSLEEKGKAQEREIISAAHAEARKIAKQAEQEAKEAVEKAKQTGQTEGNEQKAEMYASARLRAKRIVAESREKAVETALETLREELKDFVKSKKYAELLVKLAKSGVKAIGKDAVLKCRKEDEKTLKATGFDIAMQIQCTGGVIVESASGKIRVNNTLDSLLEQFRPQLKQRAYEELFGKGKKSITSQQLKIKANPTNAKQTQNKQKIKKKQKNKQKIQKEKTRNRQK